ncbi:hypothetical protein ES703_124375 [subsurface metagenome]
MEKKVGGRSRGIIAFGIVAILFAGIGLFQGIPLAIGMIQKSSQWTTIVNATPLPLPYFRVSVTIGIIISSLLLISGIGLLKIKSWARKLVLGISVIIILRSLISLTIGLTIPVNLAWATPRGRGILIFTMCAGSIFYILILWYFNRAIVKEQFQKLK